MYNLYMITYVNECACVTVCGYTLSVCVRVCAYTREHMCAAAAIEIIMIVKKQVLMITALILAQTLTDFNARKT